jgi:DNA modification methylase
MSVPTYFQPNTIYCGDCKDILRKFPEKSIDLIYADPPFFSNRHYEVIWGDGYELRAFEDRWKGGINNYVEWMVERLQECYRVLRDNGSMYLHCDWHASHYLKIEMDRLFGIKNFRNEIIWPRTYAHSDFKQGAKAFGRIHDTILFYSKSDDSIWNQLYKPYEEEYTERTFRSTDKKGRSYQTVTLTAAKAGGDTEFEWHGITPPKGRYWAYSRENLDKLEKQGKIVFSKSGIPRLKKYLDESSGISIQDVWDDIRRMSTFAKERLGYPTQKPEALMERIIKASSNEDNIVLDPFCGCGTTIAVASKLKRKWIGIDVSPTACELMEKRMRSHPVTGIGYHVVGMPMDSEGLKNLEPFEFQNWVIKRLYGRVSDRKSSDMEIDGYTYEGNPVQVKQSESIGRNIVDNFETALKRAKKSKGMIVAFSFGKGAHEEIARAKLHEELEIEAITVQDLLKNRRNNKPV